MCLELWAIPCLLGGGVGVGGLFVGEVEAGFWVIVSAEEMDRDFCASMFSLKYGVEGFEENGFESGGHIGKFGFGFERAVKSDGFGVNIIGAVHECGGAGDGKGEIGECGDCVAQFDVAGKIGDDALEIVGIGIGVRGGFGVCIGSRG